MAHKWTNEIKAWLDGTPVEFRSVDGGLGSLCQWLTFLGPLLSFDNHRLEFRIKKDKKKGWINIYDGIGEVVAGRIHPSKECADSSRHQRLACIEIEYEEGQGL